MLVGLVGMESEVYVAILLGGHPVQIIAMPEMSLLMVNKGTEDPGA